MKHKTKKVFVIDDPDIIDSQKCLGDMALEYARQHKEEFESFLKNKKIQSKENNDEKEK